MVTAATARVAIDSIAAGGDGVGRAEGLAVFVPRTAPGDVADVTLSLQGRFARGTVSRLVHPAADRIEPRCRHYVRDRCGGCQLQHMDYDAQLRAKARIVSDAMQRIARRPLTEVDVRRSPAAWHYRNKLTLALRRAHDTWIAGLHAYDNPDQVFALEECPITDDRVVAGWREVIAAGELLPRARALRGAVRLSDQGLSFVLEGGRTWQRAYEFADRAPSLRAIWWEPDRGGRRRTILDRRGAATPDASFAQVNPSTAVLLRTHVVEMVLRHKPAAAIDAYAGAGATASMLASAGVAVTAIELDPIAARWSANELPPGSRSIAARVENALPDALPADVVVLNPPRAGVHERVTAALAEATPQPRAVVYVSCNPATLARDVARLPNYRIASLVGFDMFPQTAHVETVCELVPAAA